MILIIILCGCKCNVGHGWSAAYHSIVIGYDESIVARYDMKS